jgi:RNA polymerase sigma factor (TIGR02999 family)
MRRERPDHTLQTTALVNEAYVRLIDQKHVECENRTQFFAIAAQLMRHVLVDHARSRQYLKRGGGALKVSLDEAMAVIEERTSDLIALDDALNSLAAIDSRKVKVVELRFFGGLSVEETAAALNISPVTVMRDWRMAKAWLYDAMNNEV